MSIKKCHTQCEQKVYPNPMEKTKSMSKKEKYAFYRETRPQSLDSPQPEFRSTRTEVCVIVCYKYDENLGYYVLNLVGQFEHRLKLIPSLYYTNETKEPWKLERNYKWSVTYSTDYDTYGQIQSMVRGEWLHPKFFLNFAFL